MYGLLLGTLVSILVSTAAVAALSRPLHAVLSDICETERRSRFWLRFTNLMLFLTPLLTVILFGMDGTPVPFDQVDVTIVRRVLGSTLTGLFVALLGIGFKITRVPSRTRSEVRPLGRGTLFENASQERSA